MPFLTFALHPVPLTSLFWNVLMKQKNWMNLTRQFVLILTWCFLRLALCHLYHFFLSPHFSLIHHFSLLPKMKGGFINIFGLLHISLNSKPSIYRQKNQKADFTMSSKQEKNNQTDVPQLFLIHLLFLWFLRCLHEAVLSWPFPPWWDTNLKILKKR